MVLDVTDQASVDALLGGIDGLKGLVNCAGILMRGRGVRHRQVPEGRRCELGWHDAHVSWGAMTCLAASGGAIVNTASMLSFFGGPLVPGYSASKGGVAQLTKSLAGKVGGRRRAGERDCAGLD